MTARVLQDDDLKALAALRLEGIRLFPQAFLLTEAEALEGEGRLRDWVAGGGAIGLFEDDHLIGFAGLRRIGVSMAAHRAQVGPFYVTPAHHGTGAADRLLSQVCDTARGSGASQLELHVAAPNTRARAFYARHGFRVTGTLPRAIIQNGTAIDDLLMVRDLTADLPQPGPDGLRRLGPGDWRAFRDVRLEMLLNAPRSFGSTHADWAKKAPDEIMNWLETIHLWAEIGDGRVLSCAGWSAGLGAVVSHRGTVIAVYTRPEVRGRGLANSVLAALEDDARAHGVTQLELSVGLDNAAAQATYEGCGYRRMGTIPDALNYSGNLVDQYEMVKTIADRHPD
ncbi:GNAT family N-acetyltransferase [Rhodobacterales bacterium HKCCE4037]|nr:GNAT family N-acetyltransferase [Rhodobacterales bacterium HKCCE4037]